MLEALMKAGIPRLLLVAALIAAGFASAWLVLPHVEGQAPIERSLKSGLVRVEDAVPTRGPWGEWRRYFRGDTHGTRDMIVLAVTLKPGQAPHPPHQHAEEEFMILTEGTGTWTVEGKDFPARKGDVVYAAPWAVHGVKNTGRTPLTYYMVKWSNKGVKAPAKPMAKEKGPVDLTKIGRRIAKEPAYQSKPKYCLLVFGPKAETRVWLVLDGKTLYVDRSGKGDLTGAGKRLENPKAVKAVRFGTGPIKSVDGTTTYPNVFVHVPLVAGGDRPTQVVVLPPPALQKAGVNKLVTESERRLTFANRPEDAPIVHFDGPLSFELEDPTQVFVRGPKPTPLAIMIGTRGLGQGTFAALSFPDNAPAGAAEITFPNRQAGGKPIVVQVPLKPPD
jgi:mannose-6-phosphate isomerase-like protein (cupin superfamily)